MSFAMPQAVRQVVRNIERNSGLNEAITALKARGTVTELVAVLAGIAAVPDASRRWDNTLDELWSSAELPIDVGEVVIGGGLHAAVYAASRCRMGLERPLVLEAGERAGGAFAVSTQPSFFLNSRNRPGGLSIPGGRGALNAIPNGPIQPADLSVAEYQRNNDLAFCIRAALATCADVRTSARVTSIDKLDDGSPRRYAIQVAGRIITCDRIIVASGLGKERTMAEGAERVLTYSQFMARFSGAFPLDGMQRVAVIGTGDGGKTVVEALAGQGPGCGLSCASSDWVDQIDWYGLEGYLRDRGNQISRQGWEDCNRPRYRGIGRLLPDNRRTSADMQARLFAYERAQIVSGGFECAFVNERPYDYVIDATGYERRGDVGVVGLQAPFNVDAAAKIDGRTVGGKVPGEDVFVVGPAARIELGELERAALPTGVDENSVALFRYASRTATLGARLPRVQPPMRVKQYRSSYRDNTVFERQSDGTYNIVEVGNGSFSAYFRDKRTGYRADQITSYYGSSYPTNPPIDTEELVAAEQDPSPVVEALDAEAIRPAGDLLIYQGKVIEKALTSLSSFADDEDRYGEDSDQLSVGQWAWQVGETIDSFGQIIGTINDGELIAIRTYNLTTLELEETGGYTFTQTGETVWGARADEIIGYNRLQDALTRLRENGTPDVFDQPF
jgi:cation diffusion facilitator CzcD-associated flavoprotein CzcO